MLECLRHVPELYMAYSLLGQECNDCLLAEFPIHYLIDI
jgi:hypothetical protein